MFVRYAEGDVSGLNGRAERSARPGTGWGWGASWASCRALGPEIARTPRSRSHVSAGQRGILMSRDVSGGGLEPPRPLGH